MGVDLVFWFACYGGKVFTVYVQTNPPTTRRVTCLSWLTLASCFHRTSSVLQLFSVPFARLSLNFYQGNRFSHVRTIDKLLLQFPYLCLKRLLLNGKCSLLFSQFSYKLTQLLIRFRTGQPLFMCTCVLYLIFMEVLDYWLQTLSFGNVCIHTIVPYFDMFLCFIKFMW